MKPHPQQLIQKYLAGRISQKEKDELLDTLLKFQNELMGVVRKWKEGKVLVVEKVEEK